MQQQSPEAQAINVRRFEPLSVDWRTAACTGGTLDMARRPLTDAVEGTICTPHVLVLATLEGGADRLEVRSACGQRFTGIDRSGTVSLVPANCERLIRLQRVHTRWISLAIDVDFLAGIGGNAPASEIRHSHTHIDDPFLFSMLAELGREFLRDGELERSYADAMLTCAAHHVHRRYVMPEWNPTPASSAKLSRWQVVRVEEYVEAHLDGELRVGTLATLLGVSEGHFHRAFESTCGVTPLAFINQRRIRRAIRLIHVEPELPTIELAIRVGYTSPSYFARLFRQVVGISPSVYRARVFAEHS